MILVLLYQCFAGFLAWFNYILIKHGRKINHFMNGALHIAAAVTIGYYTEWNYGVSCLLYTRVVFDTVLNIFRHKGVGYVSPSPMSVLDKIEKRIIMWVAGLVHKKRTFIPDGKIQWVAICFRIVILGLATWALFW